jgi:poly-gamma-glutamate capsule biosynthesis protein CapA/YwtB (metallophosphatase superfamily)
MKRRMAVCALIIFLWSCQSPASNLERTAGSSSPDVPTFAEGSPTPADLEIRPTPTEKPAPTSEPIPSLTPSPTEFNPSVELAFVGDVMLGRSLGERITSGEGETIFASVESTLQSADLAIGNLECAMGEGGVKAHKYYTFLAPPQSAALLKNAGFDLLTLANNHSFDFGTGVFQQTEKLLDAHGLGYVGAGSSEDQARAPVVFDVRGFRLAFLAYVEVPKEYIGGFDPIVWAAGPDTPGVAWADDEKIKQDLKSVDPDVDFTVVLFHFGDEGADIPNPRQIQLSRLAIDYGADLIVGSHSHILQRAEEYQGRWIFYSMGNFVFDEFTGKSNRSAILWITVSRDSPAEYSLLLLNIVDGMPRIGE